MTHAWMHGLRDGLIQLSKNGWEASTGLLSALGRRPRTYGRGELACAAERRSARRARRPALHESRRVDGVGRVPAVHSPVISPTDIEGAGRTARGSPPGPLPRIVMPEARRTHR